MFDVDPYWEDRCFNELAAQIEDDRLNSIPLNEVLEYYKYNLEPKQIKNIYLGI